MAGKSKEKATAKFMFVVQMLDGKEIAAKLKVSENTVSGWVKNGHWKEERDARLNSITQRVENIKRVIANLSEQAIELHEARAKAVKDADKQAVAWCDMQSVGIADQVSKWNKALSDLDKKNRITLDVYLEVMDDIFKSMQVSNHKLFMQTLDFQEAHIQFISSKIG